MYETIYTYLHEWSLQMVTYGGDLAIQFNRQHPFYDVSKVSERVTIEK